jgi:CDP-diacylglycerol--glycerol-3-phosphate 3-phosphatidyltransferase
MSGGSLTLPNLITVGRILACPAVFFLIFVEAPPARFAAFFLYLAAALSDVFDGYLARKHDLVTDLGKLLDPVADKLLLVATLVPFYILSRGAGPVGEIPWWGELPLWVLLVIFGRELAITLFRSYAVRKGVVISAGRSGKRKALAQNFFIGSVLLWYALLTLSLLWGWEAGFWSVWASFHRAFSGLTLVLALVLTVYSMFDYLWSHRNLLGVKV